jgi:hypothetical protein
MATYSTLGGKQIDSHNTNKYKTLDAKLAKLTQEQTKIPSKPHTFYPRLVKTPP